MAEGTKTTQPIQRQANVAIGEEEAGVKIGTRFWNLTNGQERGAVVPYVDPEDTLGVFAPDTVLSNIQQAINEMNTDSRFMVLFRPTRDGDKHILEFKYGEPNLAKNENWAARSETTGIKCECHKKGLCKAKVQQVEVSESATKGTVIHELMHVLGFKHEHQLTQRDIFVFVDPQKVQANPANFGTTAVRVPPPDPRDKPFTYYDPLSIMHYPLCDEIQSTGMLDHYIKHLATHVFTDKTEDEIRESIGGSEELSVGDVRAVECLYGPYNVPNVCTYAAFLADNMCEHESYCLPTAKDQKMCQFCVENCYSGEKFEDSEGPRGFVCACKNRDQHVKNKYETLVHLYQMK